MDAHFTYGAPFTSPEGAFAGAVDALGGPIQYATVWMGRRVKKTVRMSTFTWKFLTQQALR